MKSLDRVLGLLLPLSVSVSLGQIGSVDPQGRPESHAIKGQVVNRLTNEPIARALVQYGDRHSALTDHEGRFEFDGSGDFTGPILATKPGYFSDDTPAYSTAGPFILPLIPEAILSGTVLADNGQPAQDMQVQLKTLQVRSGLIHWEQVQATTTNAEGEFRFAELRAGKYRVSTGFQVEGLPDAATSLALVPVVYPPPAGDNGSDALTLKPGDRLQANLIPPAEKLYRVTGILNGMVGQGAGFEITTQDGEMISPALHLYPAGAFWFRLPTGVFHVKARSFNQDQQLVGEREIQVGHAALEGVSINLAPQTSLPVEVEYQTVVTGTQHDQPDPPPYVNLSLEQSDTVGSLRVFNAEPVSPTNGADPPRSLVIKNVEPGHYELRAQANPSWYVASATCGNLDLMRDPLVISSGSGACTIRAVLRNDAASVKWSIAPGEQGKGTGGMVYVVALPLGTLTQVVQSASLSDANSDVATGTLPGLAPGKYLILALRHQQELPYREPGAMEKYLSLGQEVTLSRNGETEVQLHQVEGGP